MLPLRLKRMNCTSELSHNAGIGLKPHASTCEMDLEYSFETILGPHNVLNIYNFGDIIKKYIFMLNLPSDRIV